jgi:hypothetical protein
MPHESATAALKTMRFLGGPFHDSFHAAALEQDAMKLAGLQATPWNVTPWTYRVIVSEYTLPEASRPRQRYEVTVADRLLVLSWRDQPLRPPAPVPAGHERWRVGGVRVAAAASLPGWRAKAAARRRTACVMSRMASAT